MKIGIVVDNELNNDKRVLREAEILRNHGYEVSVLCFGFGNMLYESPEGLTVVRKRINRRWKNTMFFFQNLFPCYERFWKNAVKQFLIENKIEALHVHDLYLSKAAHEGIMKSGRPIPMVLDLHENYPYAVTTYNWTKGFPRRLLSQPRLWIKKEKEYLDYADRIITLSDEFSDLLIKKYPELPTRIFTAIPNVPDLSEQIGKADVTLKVVIKESGPVLFYYGVVAERRGIFDVLEAFESLIREGKYLVLMIIGPADKKDRRKFKKSLSSPVISRRVYYLPWIDGSELPAYLKLADICLAPFHKNPQHESGVANKIFDYMLGAKPVVASDCLPQKRLIEQISCGIIYSDIEEMKEAIRKLSADGNLRKKMGDSGYKAILDHYNTDLIRERLLLLYTGLSTGRQP
jgi:glycosyltransferase involved in cell wall biosynthesis